VGLLHLRDYIEDIYDGRRALATRLAAGIASETSAKRLTALPIPRLLCRRLQILAGVPVRRRTYVVDLVSSAGRPIVTHVHLP
jgi:hypothetical protein